MEKLILTDADGTILRWFEGFDYFMNMKNIPRVVNTDYDYKLSTRYGISEIDVARYVKDFNESHYIADLDPFADSVEYIEKLSNLGFRFVVISSLSDAPSAKLYRTTNLCNIFGNIFDDVICLRQGSDKDISLSKWKDTGLFWIEDHPIQAQIGHDLGLKSILIDRPYNHHYKNVGFPRVSSDNSWEQIYELILKEYNS